MDNTVVQSPSETDNDEDYDQLNANQNRKQKRAGGWQSMGLDHAVFKGILQKGYKQPTPIQRKAIPLVCSGCDVVAMSRTGSGKTAAFVVPMLQKLKKRDIRGVRALLLSPTRELALQTFKIVKELGGFTGLYCACLIGGDSMDDQFSVLHDHPDIVLATPGRLLHLVVEMDLKLNMVQYIVFDEADRLFEMGLTDQLKEILKRTPESRQTLLFSATLPKMLVGFAKADLTDPQLVRLDVESKINEKLGMAFVQCCQLEKLPLLLNLCRTLNNQKKKTIIFCATMKHVEHLVSVFQQASLDPAYLYSQLDPIARKQNINRFRNDDCPLLIVTDIAARGVDIPLLDYAINYHFPPKSKLFVHRVGRVARAGKSGTSITLVAPDEFAYLVDLFLFIGRPLQFVQSNNREPAEWDRNEVLIGAFPDSLVHHEMEFLHSIEQTCIEIGDLKRKADNAMKKYRQTRPQPSKESMRRVKAELRNIAPAIHPLFLDKNLFPEMTIENSNASSRELLLNLKNWRPNQAIFEFSNSLGGTGAIKETSSMKATTKNFSRGTEKKAKEKAKYYIDYKPKDANTEEGLALREDVKSFENAANEHAVEMTADDDKGLYIENKRKRWDRKKKKFVSNNNEQGAKRIRTEEGALLPASYKSGRYDKWKKRQKLDFQHLEAEDVDQGDGENLHATKGGRSSKPPLQKMTKRNSINGKNGGELRNIDQIVKTKRKKARVQAYQAHRREENRKSKQRTNRAKK